MKLEVKHILHQKNLWKTIRKGRKWVSLERLSDGRIRFYDNESLMVEEVKVIG